MKLNHEHKCIDKVEPQFLQIGMFAHMNHVSIKTLRHYDEYDLLKPAYVNIENGYRYYTTSQIADLHQILALKDIGFSLEEIKNIQKEISNKNILINKKQQILIQISTLTNQLAKIESYLNDDDTILSSPILIKSLPEVIVASSWHKIDDYDSIFDLMPQMGLEMEKLGCQCAQPDYCFIRYLDDEYKDSGISIEMCQAVTEIKENTDKLSFQILPKVKEAACIFHKGSYDTFPKSYAKLLQFIENNHYKICGHFRESYIDGVWNKESSEEWLSEIQVPICQK